MKCEKCGKEATFHYQSNINNVKTEKHFCEECSREEGLSEMFGQVISPMFGSPMLSGFLGMPFGTAGGFPRSFFEPVGTLFSPVVAMPFFNLLPAAPGFSTSNEEKNADNIPEDAGSAFRKKREISALRHQMQHAIKAEEFEKAAELRDKIREMER